MNRILPAFILLLSFGFSSGALANNFSPTIEREKREGSITMEQALERSSIRTTGRRPGLGSFTRRVHNRSTTNSRTRTNRADRPTRTSTTRIYGGRNGYARYLRSQEIGNSNRVSRLRPGRVDPADTADTEANTR